VEGRCSGFSGQRFPEVRTCTLRFSLRNVPLFRLNLRLKRTPLNLRRRELDLSFLAFPCIRGVVLYFYRVG
jgi:hypothetical protein